MDIFKNFDEYKRWIKSHPIFSFAFGAIIFAAGYLWLFLLDRFGVDVGNRWNPWASLTFFGAIGIFVGFIAMVIPFYQLIFGRFRRVPSIVRILFALILFFVLFFLLMMAM